MICEKQLLTNLGDERIMMNSPGGYIAVFENAGYLELIKERDRLIKSIKSFEKDEMVGNRSSFGWYYCQW